MEPSATPPWRVLDAPSPAAGAGATSPSAPEAAGHLGPTPVALKALGIGAAAIVCALAAFFLASGGGEASVRVDGGATMPVASGTAASGGSTAAGGAAGAARVGELVVEIVGAVTRPGVYRLPSGSRVGDLVAAAGGYGSRVDTTRAADEMNLAAALRDGDQVRVPSRDDAVVNPASTAGAAGAAAASGDPASTLDLNDATQAELETLPGIGPATALKIIAAREEAPFAAVEELRSRGVLGEKTYEKVRELVAVR